MYLCICHAVTDHEIRAEIRAGARSEEEIGLRCGAGTGCGYCVEQICDLLRVADPADEAASLTPAAGANRRLTTCVSPPATAH